MLAPHSLYHFRHLPVPAKPIATLKMKNMQMTLEIRNRKQAPHSSSSRRVLSYAFINRLVAILISLWTSSTLAQDFLWCRASAESAPTSLMTPEVGSRSFTNWNIGFALGGGFGARILGSTERHDLAISTLHIGKLLVSDPLTSRSFLHHIELAGALWSGAQFHPESAYLVGLTPTVRYHFLPGARLSPFVDAGAGVTATDIGHPDLSTAFEFNLQAGAGLHWFWRQNVALTFETRYIHLSNAGLDTPNLGVNSFLFSGGLTWVL